VVLAAGCRDQRELGLGERERSAGVIVLAHSPYPVRSTLLATVSPAWTIYGRRLGRTGRNVWRWPKTQLSQLLQMVEQGEEVVIARAGVPIARPDPAQRRLRRPVGWAVRGAAVTRLLLDTHLLLG